MIKKSNRELGFTLVEVMIVMAIVAILASIAVPAYNDSVNRGRHSDALIALEKAAAMQEQHYFQNSQYAANIDDLGGVSGTLTSPEGHYVITTTSTAVANDFTLTATASSGGAQSDTDCYAFRLASTGAKTAHTYSDASISDYSTNQPNCLRD